MSPIGAADRLRAAILLRQSLLQTPQGRAAVPVEVGKRPGWKLPRGAFRATKAVRKRLRRETARAGALRSAASHGQSIYLEVSTGKFRHTRPGAPLPEGSIEIRTAGQFDQSRKLVESLAEPWPAGPPRRLRRLVAHLERTS